MAPIQNGGLFTLRLFTSEDGVKFLCLSYVTNMTGLLKIDYFRSFASTSVLGKV